jgi:hypothetical protein
METWFTWFVPTAHHNTNDREVTMFSIIRNFVPFSGMTDTAYVVETAEGRAFVPYTKVHPLVAASPLVVLV